MGAYILKRLLLMIPTLLGIMLMTFAVIQFVPGGPIEQVIAKMQGTDTDSTGRVSGDTGNEAGGQQNQAIPATRPVSSTVARKGSIRNSSSRWKCSSASTSPPPSAS